MDQSRLADKLELLVRTLSNAGSAPDVFRALIEGLPLIAPRSAIYLVRQNSLKGWRCLGYPPNAAERLRALSLQTDSPASRIGTDGLADLRSDGMPSPNFGQSPPQDSVAVTVTVKSKPIALIVAERNSGELPWHPSALSMLAHTARLRLELSLAERKTVSDGTGASASVSSANSPTAPAPTPSSMPVASRPAPQMTQHAAPTTARMIDASAAIEAAVPMMASPAKSEVRPSGDVHSSVHSAAEARKSDPRFEAAKRFARLVATDIRLYNEEAVVLGRRNGDLAERLGEPIALGQRSFSERFGDMGPEGTQLLQQALVDILAGGDRSLLGL